MQGKLLHAVVETIDFTYGDPDSLLLLVDKGAPVNFKDAKGVRIIPFSLVDRWEKLGCKHMFSRAFVLAFWGRGFASVNKLKKPSEHECILILRFRSFGKDVSHIIMR